MRSYKKYSFTCHPHMSHICLYSPAARRHSRLAGTCCAYPRRDGQAELSCRVAGGWLHTEIHVCNKLICAQHKYDNDDDDDDDDDEDENKRTGSNLVWSGLVQVRPLAPSCSWAVRSCERASRELSSVECAAHRQTGSRYPWRQQHECPSAEEICQQVNQPHKQRFIQITELYKFDKPQN